MPVIYTDSSQTKIIESGNLKGGDSTGIGSRFFNGHYCRNERLENDPIRILK